MSFPDFVCIGAQKAGTTWLHQMLAKHPKVWLGPFKEYQFFNSMFVPEHTQWTKWHVEKSTERALRYHIETEANINFRYVKFLSEIATPERMFTEAWYRHIFSFRNGMVKGDITPEYSTLPDAGVDYFLRLLGAVPVIYLIRHPVSRAISQLKMSIDRGGMVCSENRDVWAEAIKSWDVQNRGDYRSYVPRWTQRFPKDKLLFIPYRDIASKPADVLAAVEKHVGLPAHTYPNASNKVHEGKKITLPSFVEPMVEEAMRGQVDFLREYFGQAFLDRT